MVFSSITKTQPYNAEPHVCGPQLLRLIPPVLSELEHSMEIVHQGMQSVERCAVLLCGDGAAGETVEPADVEPQLRGASRGDGERIAALMRPLQS